MSDKKTLLPLVQRYFETNPLEASRTLETLDEERVAGLLKSLSATHLTKVLAHLNDNYLTRLLENLPDTHFDHMMNHLETDRGAHILLELSTEKRQRYLTNLDSNKKREIQEVLDYPQDSAGRIMSRQFLSFHSDLKIKEVIQRLRQLVQKKPPSSYIYVTDRENHLAGVLNMRDMLLAPQDTRLDLVMRKDVFTINFMMDREVIAQELASRKYFAAPVVDNENKLLGVVKAESLIGGVQEEATEDIQKMFGASGNERAFSPVWFSLKTRLPWLHVNLGTAFLAAAVVAMFEETIAKITVLAVYLPVVAGQGGNAGAQSLAIVMRGLVMREIPRQKIKALILKEGIVGTVNGIVIGLVTGLIAWIWQGNPFLGIVIGLGMLVNLTIAGLSGAVIPLVMKSLRLDPAQCSSIILTTITDVMGFFAFLGFAVLFQNYLI